MTLKCPICTKDLSKHENGIHRCSAGHGSALSGSQLSEGAKVGSDDIDGEGVLSKVESTQQEIDCPRCNNPMVKNDYLGLGVIIDVCNKCGMRWIDQNELNSIKKLKSAKAKRPLSADRALAVAEVVEGTRQNRGSRS